MIRVSLDPGNTVLTIATVWAPDFDFNAAPISSHALNMTKQFQLRNPRPEMDAVDRWLTALKQRYEDWLHRP